MKIILNAKTVLLCGVLSFLGLQAADEEVNYLSMLPNESRIKRMLSPDEQSIKIPTSDIQDSAARSVNKLLHEIATNKNEFFVEELFNPQVDIEVETKCCGTVDYTMSSRTFDDLKDLVKTIVYSWQRGYPGWKEEMEHLHLLALILLES